MIKLTNTTAVIDFFDVPGIHKALLGVVSNFFKKKFQLISKGVFLSGWSLGFPNTNVFFQLYQ